MLLKKVFIRFYKSFNYDYLRKHHEDAQPHPWDYVGDAFYPYVTVPLDPRITTIVGANESGKSHLLSAIEIGVSGNNIRSSDFCRCSRFFDVTEGEVRRPDFGLEWTELSEADKKTIRETCKASAGRSFDSFIMFRTDKSGFIVYLPNEREFSTHTLTDSEASLIAKILPTTFRIDAQVALPTTVAIRDLAPEILGESRQAGESLTRENRFGVLNLADTLFSNLNWFSTVDTVTKAAQSIQAAFSPLARFAAPTDKRGQAERELHQAETQLARDLIRKVARIDQLALKELYDALREGREGHANGLITRINDALAARLNFPRFWVQDRDFALVVSPREYDLVFTIRDRTGTEYSFSERSSGLRYFLSYYIQFLAHEPQGSDTEMLLMDEPDAYLSSQAQQDLLKVFHAYAFPEGSRRRVQVVYVTHSPFLIDKNHADRIRVLEKGVGHEGTRVVRDAARNHYEPLRSAFGAFVGETAFIGNCNLMVEGIADQILLAGAAKLLRASGVPELETLDLNRLTLVPAGGAPHVPYLVYLARGRDIEKPPVVVLLDSDKAGNEARAALRKGAPYGKMILDNKFVLQIGELTTSANPGNSSEIEDLIPTALCVEALRGYAEEFWRAPAEIIERLKGTTAASQIKTDIARFSAIEELVNTLSPNYSVNKVAFARAVVAVAEAGHSNKDATKELRAAIDEFLSNFASLFRRLNELVRLAEKERSADRVAQKVDRIVRAFFLDHLESTTRERASIMLRDIEDALDESLESDCIRREIPIVVRLYNLSEEVLKPIPRFPDFRDAMERVRYAGKLATQENQPPAATGSPDSESDSREAASAERADTAPQAFSSDRFPTKPTPSPNLDA